MSDQVKMATNMSIRAAIDGITEIMGQRGTKIIFRDIGLPELAENPPPYTWDPCIPTTDQVKIYVDLIPMLGLNGAVSIWRRIGYTNIKYVVEVGHALDALTDLAPPEKFQKGLELFTMGSGKGKVIVNEGIGAADLDLSDCLLCEGRIAERPMCSLYEGVMQYIADWAYGKGVYIPRETSCMAKGDGRCYFVLKEKANS
jgi:predicted hydrocarbon binding protein